MERRAVYLIIVNPEALEALIRQAEADEQAKRPEADGHADDNA